MRDKGGAETTIAALSGKDLKARNLTGNEAPPRTDSPRLGGGGFGGSGSGSRLN